ncbi:MAG: DUF4268 domain-containing protein [Hyphomicrobiales bacterium]|nr:DUF4268 domain-containing protein [Hyphomicrobiales bacterium]
MSNLGRLEKIELRDIWKTEDRDFTPWLAQPDNMAVLADTLGIELEVEAEEKDVGPFRADILCKDVDDSSWVLIENQLERTDHTHLGQLLTYAAGLQAVTIVWIASRFTDEHRAALDWLNSATDDSRRFFGLEVELWRIGDSPAAPKFNIVSKPNEWSRSVGAARKNIETEALTENRQLQLAFWQEFVPELEAKSSLRGRKPSPKHWMNFSIGRSGFALGATINSRDNRIGVELYLGMEDAIGYFQALKEDCEEIEKSLGFSPTWQELPNKNACRIVRYLDNVAPLEKDRWPEYRNWMIEQLDIFDRVFRQRIKGLDPDEYIGAEIQ